MEGDYFRHPQRFPKNAEGPFYTTGGQLRDGTWCSDCMSCEVPENEAPSLLAPLTDDNSDTYFVRQPVTGEEIEQACAAVNVCCTGALRYGGCDPGILAKLDPSNCDNPKLGCLQKLLRFLGFRKNDG
ncbi:hypothetical protein [Massilia pseudoviolaceinigra]|uniref:hypothetical protein n=1 Tax=Massilia pseudoviolaceinigra TaxID=3057165 RepID=UPI002796B4F3|nr:hypothetical protein [Massilia sp. CCM 9206]MDQ1921118.1 hypothetical protein [Massilia sp. CCM 9206]